MIKSGRMAINNLKSLQNKKVLFFCLGNCFRGDDGIGIYIYRRIKTKNKINAGISPLNYIDKIKKFSPSCCIIIDCIDIKKRPGTIIFAPLKKIHSVSIDTHSNLLKEYINFLDINSEFYLLGIQGKETSFKNRYSESVKNSAERIIKVINTFFGKK